MQSEISSLDINNLKFSLNSLWGPKPEEKFEEFENLPFIPFTRQKPVLALFNTQAYQEMFPKQARNIAQQHQANQSAQMQIQTDEFNLVETKLKTAPTNNRFQKRNYYKKQIPQKKEEEVKKIQEKKVKKKKLKKATVNNRGNRNIAFKDTVLIKSNYEVLTELDKNIIAKTKVKKVDITEVYRTGQLQEYNFNYDRINVKTAKEMTGFQRYPLLANSNAQKDEKIMEILEYTVEEQQEEEDAYRKDQVKIANRKKARQEAKKKLNQQDQESDGEEEDDGQKAGDVPPPKNQQQVYISDTLLTALMTLKTSVFPWDISIVKDGNHYIIDKFHPDQQSYLEYQTMNENTAGLNILPLEEAEVQKICLESTQNLKTFQNLTTQEGEVWDYSEEKNILEGFTEKSVAFRYIKANIDDKIIVNVRTQIDAYQTSSKGEQIPILIRTLTENQPLRTDWRKQLQFQLGSLTSQLQIFNLCQMNKWVLDMYMSGAERLKLGFISRNIKTPENATKHTILKVMSYTYEDLKQELKIKPEECWQVIKHIITYLKEQKDGKYMLLKQSYENNLKIYYIPEIDDMDEDEDEDGNFEDNLDENQDEQSDDEDEEN